MKSCFLAIAHRFWWVRAVFLLFSAGMTAPAMSSSTNSVKSETYAEMRIVVLNSADASVSLLDPVTHIEVSRFPVGKEPHHLIATPDNKSLWVANAAGNDLVVLDPVTGEIRKRIGNIDDPYQVGFSPDQKWFVANSLRLDRVDLYQYDGGDGLKLAKRIALPKMPSHMAFSDDSKKLFVTLQGNDKIAAIDLATHTVLWQMKVGPQPAGIVLTPDQKYLLVGIMGSDYVEVIDWRLQKSVGRIVTGKGAHNFRALGDKRHLFVSNRVSNQVTLLDLQALKVVGQIPVMGGPDCMEVSEDRKTMWVTSRWKKQVSVVDIEKRAVTQVIPVGRSPHGIYFRKRAGDV
ncbi:MAG: YncE family protein [Burkholderiaceae bacterium]